MPVKPNFNPDYLYFLTTNAVQHTHLFKRDVIKRLLIDSFHYLRTDGRMELFAFVIMQWKLVENPEDYFWSTAGFYLADKPCIIPIDDVREYLILAPPGLRPGGST